MSLTDRLQVATTIACIWGSLGLLACSASQSVGAGDSGPPPRVDSGPRPDVGPVEEPDAHPDVQVTMNANDPSGSGGNTQETYLNVDNVKPASFGKLFSRSVDGDIYAQPLYASALKQKDGTTRNVVFVATSNDSVYAFDADDPSASKPLWKVPVGTPSPMPNAYVGNHLNYPPGCKNTPRFINELGVTATPVLDVAAGILYVLAVDVDSATKIKDWSCIYPDSTQANYCETYTCTAPTFRYQIHALDILTGAERANSPVTVNGSTKGSGGGSTGGTLPFDTMTSFARTGLLLANGKLYFATAGYSDLNVYHGWVFAYDAATLKQVGSFCDTPNGVSGGIWQGGRSLLSDADGNVYVTTGNGTFTAGSGGEDYGDSVIKLDANLTQVLDYFSSFLSDYNGNNFLANNDEDLSSAGATMIPNTTLLLVTGKLGNGYLLDTGKLGKFNGTGDKVVQEIRMAWPTTTTSCVPGYRPSYVYGTPVVWTGADATGAVATHVYVWGLSDNLREYELNANGQFHTSGVCFCSAGPQVTVDGSPYMIDVPDPPCGQPHTQNDEIPAFGGGALSVSSNGKEKGTGVLWVTHATSGNPNNVSSPGVLEAYDATYVKAPIWSSATNASRDGLGNWAKFTPPTVANGKVYAATFSQQLVVYGLLGKQ
jgi:hypothetical protein